MAKIALNSGRIPAGGSHSRKRPLDLLAADQGRAAGGGLVCATQKIWPRPAEQRDRAARSGREREGFAMQPSVSSAYEIVAREDFSDVTFLLEVRHPLLARAARPGQFVIVMEHEHGERIPLTIADFDREAGTITLVIQAVGKTTREMQQNCRVGTRLHALVGPMGVPSHIGGRKKVVCVGGGLGVAPVYPQARAWKESGAYVIAVLGFRNRDLVFWEDKFRACCDELLLCTDDGSAGIKGLVTDGIRAIVARHADIEELVAIGPPVMMKGCAELTRQYNIRTTVSLNPVMVDGTGMCGGCRVKIGDSVKFACVEGPDFDGHLVDFDDLMARLTRYRGAEQEALARWQESCRIRGDDDMVQEAAPALDDRPSTDG
jgi:NAD(P)H-flavin reductase